MACLKFGEWLSDWCMKRLDCVWIWVNEWIVE